MIRKDRLMRANGFRPNRVTSFRRVALRLLAVVAGVSGLLLPSEARADLTGDFADALSIDAQWLTGASAATDIAFAPDGRAVVTRRTGEITVRLLDGTKKTTTGQFPTIDNSFQEKGLTGVVADPAMANGFFFYADDGQDTADKHRVYHGVLAEDGGVTVDRNKPIIAKGVNAGDPGLEGPLNHNGGGMEIYNGFLYVAVGDTGHNPSGSTVAPNNKYTSCLNKGNGKILRVNLDGTIPSDNPLSAEAMVTSCDTYNGAWGMAAPDKRIYAWGLRNSFRFWVDPHTGRMWIADVGEFTNEEVSVSDPAAGYTGQHFGYPFNEGMKAWGDVDSKNCSSMQPSRQCVAPVYQYTHSGGSNCIIGGLIPEGCGWNKAFGGALYYWFADNGASWVHALTVKADRTGVMSSTSTDVGTFQGAGPAAIRQGPGGAVYLVNNKEGSVYEVKPKDQTGDDCQSMMGTGGMGAGGSGVAGSAGVGAVSGGGTGTGAVSGSGNQTAGAGGTATAGSGGRPSAGGSAGTAMGAGGSTGGNSATGGSGASGGGGSGAAGGTTSVAGSTSSQAGVGTKPPGSAPPADKGCGCRLADGGSSSLGFAAAGLGMVALALRRRRRS